jgi:hypothetical protein
VLWSEESREGKRELLRIGSVLLISCRAEVSIVTHLISCVDSDVFDHRSPPSRSRQRLTVDVSPNELSDQLRIAVVKGVGARHADYVNVRHHSEARRIRNPDEWITQTGDHQGRNDKTG